MEKFEDFLILLIKYRKTIITNVLVVTILAIIVSLLMVKEYTAVASVIPPKNKSGLFGDISSFSSTIQNITKSLGGRLGNVSEEAYNYLAILKSRTASEDLIKKFNLRKVYDIDTAKPYEYVIKALQNNVDFNVEDEGNILISVTDKSPDRAAEMANYYVKVLNEVSTRLGVTEARDNREFIGKRFKEIQNNISNLEDSLKDFGEKYNVLAMDEQMKAEITAAAELKALLEQTKIERYVLINNYGANSPLVEQVTLKIQELDKRLSIMKYGNDKDLKSAASLFIPFKNVPDIGVKYLRLKRDYESQTKLLQFIYPMYEQAKIEEQRDTPAVLVLDKAIPPQKKSSPKRAIIVIVSFLLSFMFSIVFVIVKDSYSNMQVDEIRYSKIKNGIINPAKNFFKFKKNKI